MIEQNTAYDLSGVVIGLAMRVHRELGHGFNEKVYQNALAIELAENNLSSEVEKQLKVYYKDNQVGEYFADIMVKETLILELKAVQNLCEAHEAQLVNYLTATNIEEGLLINFGAPSLQFKKKYKTYRPQKTLT
jgi:GxxExxY protein